MFEPAKAKCASISYSKPENDVIILYNYNRWRATQWGQCSKSCAGGQHHRSVDCVEENNNVEKVAALNFKGFLK